MRRIGPKLMATEPADLCIVDLAHQIAGGNVSAETVTQACIERIKQGQSLGAVLHVAQEAALAAARQIDARRTRGERLGKLAGVPIAIKDAICTVDAPTTAGSKILTHKADGRGWQPPYDATVISRLRAEDAIIIAKTNMDEFAMGSSNENSAFGPVRNPWDTSRIPGGSSGGSAVAVAARLCPGALGSDTGGSIRQPASMCGVVGVKPSYGRVPRYGLIAYASSLDQVGPFARDVRGAARLLGVIAGADERDSTASSAPCPDYEAACNEGLGGLRIGIPKEYFGEGIDPKVEAVVRKGIDALEQAGARLLPIELPHTHYGIATYYVVATAEASSNLSRFDGMRFGLREESAGDPLAIVYNNTRGAGFGAEVKRRILLGTYVLSHGYYDAYYDKALRVRTLIRRDFERAFESVDVIATPAAPSAAFPIGSRLEDPLAMYLADVFQVPASLAGLAGISVPAGSVVPDNSADKRPLPVGIQFLAPALGEPTMFRVASAFEAISGWDRASPPAL